MTHAANLPPINEADLDEHWYSLRLKTWKAVAAAVKACRVDQKKLADRISMDPGQFNRVITGKSSNVTLRTLHNIARAVGYRLRVSLEPLAELPKPNYTYEDARRDRMQREARLENRTEGPMEELWTRATSDSDLVTA